MKLMNKAKRQEDPKLRSQRMLDYKIAVMREEREKLDRLEKNIKHLAKELGIKLTRAITLQKRTWKKLLMLSVSKSSK